MHDESGDDIKKKWNINITQPHLHKPVYKHENSFGVLDIFIFKCSLNCLSLQQLERIKLTSVVQECTQTLLRHKYHKDAGSNPKKTHQRFLQCYNDKHKRGVRCLQISSILFWPLPPSAWAVQLHTSPYCAASRHAIDFALLHYHLLFLTFPSHCACCIYFLLTFCLFSFHCVPS